MQGVFEKQNSYPFVATPLGGWGHSDPSGKAVIRNIANEQFVKLEGDGYTYVATDAEATQFSDLARAAIAGGDLLAGIKASAAKETVAA